MYDVNKYLTPHFQLGEFLHERSVQGLRPYIYGNLVVLAQALESIRRQFGNKPIHINSGFRTAEHNKEVGGVVADPKKPGSGSLHLYGLAADIVVEGYTAHQVQKVLKNWPGGLGSYDTWTHVDLGPKSRWTGK